MLRFVVPVGFQQPDRFIYHILDGKGPTCYELLAPAWDVDRGHKVEFRAEHWASVQLMLEKLLDASPVGRILFTSDYQFCPEEARRFGPILFSEFKRLHDARRVRMNAAYLITSTE